MGRQSFNVDQRKPMGGSQATYAAEREVRKVLVVDGVKLVFRDQALKMRHLDGDDALRRQQVRHAGDEVVELRHLCQHIVGDDQIGVPPVGHHFSRGFGIEEGDECRNACLSRGFRHIGSGFDAKNRHAEFNEMLQQITVIAAQFDDEAIRSKSEPAFYRFAVAGGVRHPRRRIG